MDEDDEMYLYGAIKILSETIELIEMCLKEPHYAKLMFELQRLSDEAKNLKEFVGMIKPDK